MLLKPNNEVSPRFVDAVTSILMAKDPSSPLALGSLVLSVALAPSEAPDGGLEGDAAFPRPRHPIPLSPGHLQPGCHVGFATGGPWPAGHSVCWPAPVILPLSKSDRALPVSPRLPRSAGFLEADDRAGGGSAPQLLVNPLMLVILVSSRGSCRLPPSSPRPRL